MTDQPTNPNEFILIVAYTPLRTNSNKSFKSHVGKSYLIALTKRIKVGPTKDLMPENPVKSSKAALCVTNSAKGQYALICGGSRLDSVKIGTDNATSLADITNIDAIVAEYPYVFTAQGPDLKIYHLNAQADAAVEIANLNMGCRQTYCQGRYSTYGRGLVYQKPVLYCLNTLGKVEMASMANCFDKKNTAEFDSSKVELKEQGENLEHFNVRDTCLVTVDGKDVSLCRLEFTAKGNVRSVKEEVKVTLPDSDTIWYGTIGISESCIIVGGSSADRSDRVVGVRSLSRKTLKCIDHLEFTSEIKNEPAYCCPHQISFIYHKKTEIAVLMGVFHTFNILGIWNGQMYPIVTMYMPYSNEFFNSLAVASPDMILFTGQSIAKTFSLIF